MMALGVPVRGTRLFSRFRNIFAFIAYGKEYRSFKRTNKLQDEKTFGFAFIAYGKE